MDSPSSREVNQILRATFICFFISGSAGLIYEIIWIRMLGLIFGHTVYAITTVLVVFMGGLALGSYLCGRVADRIQNLLRLYGLLEIGIGLYCLLIPWIMIPVKQAYLLLAGAMELSYPVFTLIQFLLVSLALLIPTTLMGATLPILSRFFVRDISMIGRRVGALYAYNTFGAVLGVYLAGFELLPALGMQWTLVFAATLNIGIGLLILQFGQRLKRVQGEVPESGLQTPVAVSSGSRIGDHSLAWEWPVMILVTSFAFSGAASMVYEIAWTRALSLIIGSSTYAFSAMLLSFLIGIAAGSAIFARVVRTHRISPVWFAGLQLAIGLSAAAVLPLFDRFPDLFLDAFRIIRSYSLILVLQVFISFVAMILPTLFIGATFPCLVQIVSRDLSRTGFDVGRLYAINTMGAILGSFMAGFVLLPLIGVEACIKVGIMINLSMGLFILLSQYQRSLVRIGVGAAVSAAMMAVLLLPRWDQEVMSSGVSIYAPMYMGNHPEASLRDRIQGNEILYYKDGISSTVTVHREGETLFLRVNGKTDASTRSDMHTQLMLGHLPALLHPDPRTALVIGLGSGVTAGALTQYNLDRIDVVELEPAIIEASDFFKKENREVLSRPNVRVTIADGRNFLLIASNKYDLIISEPSNPWIGGIATLYTVEAFNLERERLNPGGIMAQWFHGYSLSPDDLRMVVATFRSVFPNATFWITNKSDYILVGTLEPLEVDLERIQKLYESNSLLREDLDRMKIDSPEAILADFYLNEEEMGQFAQGADLNTDDLLPLEFSAPRSLYMDTIDSNMLALRSVKQSMYPPMNQDYSGSLELPEIQYQVAKTFISKNMFKEGSQYLDSVLKKDPDYIPARIERGRLKAQSNRILDAMDDFKLVLDQDPESAEAHNQLGLIYLKQKILDRSIDSFKRAVALDPEDSEYHLNLAGALRRNQQVEEAEVQFRLVLGQKPGDRQIMGVLAATLIDLEKPEDAIEVLKQAIVLHPRDHRLHYQIGQAFLLLGKENEARMAFEGATTLDPLDPQPYVGLGKAWLALGNKGKALNYFKKATAINPKIAVPKV